MEDGAATLVQTKGIVRGDPAVKDSPGLPTFNPLNGTLEKNSLLNQRQGVLEAEVC